MENFGDYREWRPRNRGMLAYNNFNLRATAFNLPATTYETARPVTFPTTMSRSPRATTAPNSATANMLQFDNHPINQDLWDSVQCTGPQTTTQALSPIILTATSGSPALKYLTTLSSDITPDSYPTPAGTPSKQPNVWIQPPGPAQQQVLYPEPSSGPEGFLAQDISPQPCSPHQPSPPHAGFLPQPSPRQGYYALQSSPLQESYTSQHTLHQTSQQDLSVPQPVSRAPWNVSPGETSGTTITPPVEPANVYPCQAKKGCTESFTHKAARKRHEDRHVKPFLCKQDNCPRARRGKGFSRIDNLQSHLARVHNIQPEPKRRQSPPSYDENRIARLEEEVDVLREQLRRSSESTASRSPE